MVEVAYAWTLSILASNSLCLMIPQRTAKSVIKF